MKPYALGGHRFMMRAFRFGVAVVSVTAAVLLSLWMITLFVVHVAVPAIGSCGQ